MTAKAGRSTATMPTSSISRRASHLRSEHFGRSPSTPEGYFIQNVLNRQAIGDRDKLAFNADGSLDLYFQADSPGKDKESNWLPVAKGPFNLLMRLYWPKAEVLDGAWTPPLVKRMS
jgi:hypothetical protein